MTLLAAFDAFVARYTGQTDLVIGTPIAGRNRPEQEHLIGYFTNTLALRTDLAGDPTFREVVKRVRQTALSAYEHQELPFEVLVKELRPDRTLSYSPVFQVMFSVGHAVQAAPGFYQLETSGVFVERGTSRFDLLFGATALPDGLALACEYNTDLFEDDTIRQMVACFETLLKAALLNPDCRLSELPLLAPREIEQQVVVVERHRRLISRQMHSRTVRIAGGSHALGDRSTGRRRDTDVSSTRRARESDCPVVD